MGTIIGASTVEKATAASAVLRDNAVAESFFKTFKSELVNHVEFKTQAEARLATFEYIEVCGATRRYNRRRRHSNLHYQTPAQQESYFYTAPMAA